MCQFGHFYHSNFLYVHVLRMVCGYSQGGQPASKGAPPPNETLVILPHTILFIRLHVCMNSLCSCIMVMRMLSVLLTVSWVTTTLMRQFMRHGIHLGVSTLSSKWLCYCINTSFHSVLGKHPLPGTCPGATWMGECPLPVTRLDPYCIQTKSACQR